MLAFIYTGAIVGAISRFVISFFGPLIDTNIQDMLRGSFILAMGLLFFIVMIGLCLKGMRLYRKLKTEYGQQSLQSRKV
jgi:hypothetical protein